MVHFSAKQDCFMHSCPVVSVQRRIVKFVKMGISFSEVHFSVALPAWWSPNDIPFASLHDSLDTRVFPVAIGHLVARISARDCTRVRQLLQFWGLKKWGNAAFMARATHSLCSIVSPFCHTTLPWYVIYVMRKFQPSTPSGSAYRPFTLTPLHGKEQTGRQADRQTERQTETRTPRNLVN